MPWFWDTFEGYKSHVNPYFRDGLGPFQNRDQSSWFEHESERWLDSLKVSECLGKLQLSKFTGDRKKKLPQLLAESRQTIEVMVCAVENMLARDARFKGSPELDDFAHEKDEVLLNWDRYFPEFWLSHSVQQLIRATDRLMVELSEKTKHDSTFLTSDLALPDHLMLDWKEARDLFSVGFEEVGAFVAGRALEATLRETCRRKGISLKGKPAHETDFFKIIEIMEKLRWKKNNAPVIDKKLISLLHLLRSQRNSGAHPGGQTSSPREIATLCASAAQDVYDQIACSRAHLVERNF